MAEETPKVSVCIPTYNRGGLLGPFLTSILTQTLTDIEVIVSDNCSTDSTPEIVAAITDPRLRYHRNETNVGPVQNMNRLLALACGDYVCIAHDDDVYLPLFLERESGMLDQYPNVGMVHSAVYEVDADGIRRQIVRAYPTTRVLTGREEFIRYLQGHNVCCSSVMVRRHLYVAAAPFEPRFLCADFLMWMKLALLADVGYIADPLLEMRVHENTVTSWLNPARWHEEFMALFDEGLALGERLDPSLASQREALLETAARAQGRRFLIAALAAVARGDSDLARGYTDVLAKLQSVGLPARYAAMARLCTNPVGRLVCSAVARVRRRRARRLMAAA